jgi:hypothetical protein
VAAEVEAAEAVVGVVEAEVAVVVIEALTAWLGSVLAITLLPAPRDLLLMSVVAEDHRLIIRVVAAEAAVEEVVGGLVEVVRWEDGRALLRLLLAWARQSALRRKA